MPMDWQNEIPHIGPYMIDGDEYARINDCVCSLLYHFGPDRHIDGNEKITNYICSLIWAERQK